MLRNTRLRTINNIYNNIVVYMYVLLISNLWKIHIIGDLRRMLISSRLNDFERISSRLGNFVIISSWLNEYKRISSRLGNFVIISSWLNDFERISSRLNDFAKYRHGWMISREYRYGWMITIGGFPIMDIRRVKLGN